MRQWPQVGWFLPLVIAGTLAVFWWGLMPAPPAVIQSHCAREPEGDVPDEAKTKSDRHHQHSSFFVDSFSTMQGVPPVQMVFAAKRPRTVEETKLAHAWMNSQYSLLMQHQKELPQRFVDAIRRYVSHGPVNLLDYGAQHTGVQLCYIRELLGEPGNHMVIGLNLASASATAINVSAWCPGTAMMVARGPKEALPFANSSFDGVSSMAAMEHVADIHFYMSETLRVLREGGVFYAYLGPLYFAARGHHFYSLDDAAKAIGLPGSIYVNDGSIVPDWGHLLYSPEEMRHLLKQRLPPQEQPLVDVAVDLIYSAPHINRLPQRAYDEVLDGFVEQGAVRILVRDCYGPIPPPDIQKVLEARYASQGITQFSYVNCEWVMQKVSPSTSHAPPPAYS